MFHLTDFNLNKKKNRSKKNARTKRISKNTRITSRETEKNILNLRDKLKAEGVNKKKRKNTTPKAQAVSLIFFF